jgi:hypothetical protein
MEGFSFLVVWQCMCCSYPEVLEYTTVAAAVFFGIYFEVFINRKFYAKY